MRTSKEIGTISYNTEAYLYDRLQELLRNKVISDYMYIPHIPEKDEGKPHIHLWIKPNKLLDTMDLQEYFEEHDPSSSKPLKCIDFRPSKTDDWILYNQHYEPYLSYKGEDREFYYSKSDFRYADVDQFEHLYNHAFKGSDFARRYQILKKLQDDTFSGYDMIASGMIPLNMAGNVNAFEQLRRGSLFRNGRKTHTPKVDEDGVIIDE